MTAICQKIQQNFQSLKNWAVEEESRESRARIGRACAQIGLSWTIQKVAIMVFALQGSFVIVCSLTALGLGVAILSANSPMAAKACRFVAQFGVIQLLHKMCLYVFVHEAGHAIAGAALYRHKQMPKIEVDLFGGGRTTCISRTLSGLGNFLGRDRVKLAVAMGGPIASVVFAMGMFAWSTYQTDEASAERLAIHGGLQLASECEYAWDAIWINDPTALGNDYVAMHTWGGVHPAAALGVMLLLPVVQVLWLNRAKISSSWSSLVRSRSIVQQ